MIMKTHYGQRLILKKGINKPKTAYVLTHDEDYLVKLTDTWPHMPGLSRVFFIHRDVLDRFYVTEQQGIQMKLFTPVTRFDRLVKRHLKQH